MKTISTKMAPQAIGPYSQGVVSDGVLYTAGQIGLTIDGELAGDDIRSQTRQVLQNLSAVISEAGSTPNDVIKTTIFLSDMDDFLAVNTMYSEYFQEHKPARSTVAVKTLPLNAKVEIECIVKVKAYVN